MLIKRSFRLSGHCTSIALEPEFWAVLEQVAAAKKIGLLTLVTETDRERQTDQGLASCLRVFALTQALENRMLSSLPRDAAGPAGRV
jgi:predicted DNA-binding ribbon-helix-helix protein